MPTTQIKIPNDKTKPTINRSLEIREDVGVPINKLLVFLEDLDKTIIDYYNNTIAIQVADNNNNLIKVPLVYAMGEKWHLTKQKGILLDENGKVKLPIIAFKRTTVARDESMPIDKIHSESEGDLLYVTYDKGYTKDNVYNSFNKKNKIINKKELQTVIVPDFVNVTYSFIAQTSYIEQMNEIIQQFMYADMKYWIGNKKFRWKGEIQSIPMTIENTETDDRIIKSEFDLVIQAYLLIDRFGKEISNKRKVTSHSQQIKFTENITNYDLT